MPHVRLMSGTTRSARSAQMDALLLERPGESLLIVPSGPYARRRAAAILKRTGQACMLDPPVITFDELVARILKRSPQQSNPIDSLEQHLLLRQAVKQSPEVETLGVAAESEGLLDHLASVIAQLKQAAIEPQEFRERTRGRRHAMDAIVAGVYAAYQRELLQSGAVDRPGKYWLARIECEQATPPAGLSRIKRLLLDDFDDFTPSEFRVLKALAGHMDDIVFGMNYNADPEQQNLYALPLRTAQNIRREFDPVETLDPYDEPRPERRSEFIAGSLLVRKTVEQPTALSDDVEFIECHTPEHEIETIARRIKRLIRTEGTALHEIAVVWRKTPPAAGPMREIFREFGIPLTGLEERPLGESAIAGFMLRFLDAIQTWSPEAVLDVLTSPWFSGPDAPHTDVFPILVRAARVRPTQHGWRAALETLLRFLDDPQQIELKRLSEHIPDAKRACESLVETFNRLVDQSKTLSRSAPYTAYLSALASLLDTWPIEPAMQRMPDGQERVLEESAAAALRDVLGVLGSGLATDTARQSRGNLVQVLRRAFATTSLQLPSTAGGVACLSMEPARYLNFEYVFLAGMTDARVPAGRVLNAIYPEEERIRLNASGIPLDDIAVHNQREILLFQRMFLTARRRLFVSWHRLAADGTATQRSLYLNEVADRIGGMQAQKAISAEDVLVPSAELAACERDIQNLDMRNSSPAHHPAIAAAAALEQRRYGFDNFDVHDGVLNAAENMDCVQHDFGPAHEFSASQLETYASCPFRFFQERVLDLLTIEPPEQAFDHLARGLVLHSALERFHRHFLGKPLAEIPAEDGVVAMDECAGAAFDAVAARFRNLSPGVLAAERIRTIATLQRHLRLQRDADDKTEIAWRPTRLEAEFGGKSDVPAFTLDSARGPVRLQGKIDRVDETDGAFRLIDYKSSKIESGQIKNGKVFQLALYALACESTLIPDRQCVEALYVGVGKEKATTVALSRTNPKNPWDERVALARSAVEQAVDGIRHGRFHPTLDKTPCIGCSRHKVCRFERARIHRKPAS